MNKTELWQMDRIHEALSRQAIQTANSKTAILQLRPHYSDPAFSQGQTHVVFGRQSKDLEYCYSDRLQQWDYDKYEQARDSAKSQGYEWRTAQWHEAYLTAYFGFPLELKCIIVGVNTSNGFEYQVYGIKRQKS